MKTSIKPQTQLKVLSMKNRTSHFTKNVNSSVSVIDFKFYQKLFLVLISLSIFLILPESPKELETVCESYYSKQICNVW